MVKFLVDLFSYLKALIVGIWQTILFIFDILGIVLFFCPQLATTLEKDETLVKTIGGLIFFFSFLLANFFLYRKLVQDVSYQADIHLEILKKDFIPSSRNWLPPFHNTVPQNPGGFNKQGLPDWGSLSASIRVKNRGKEEGELIWEFDQDKTKLPSLFSSDTDKVDVSFIPQNPISGRSHSDIHFLFCILFTEQDPHNFAQALRGIIESKKQYQVVIRYKTRHIDGESKTRELRIKGDFQSFYQKILKHWEDNRFNDLVEIARIA